MEPHSILRSIYKLKRKLFQLDRLQSIVEEGATTTSTPKPKFQGTQPFPTTTAPCLFSNCFFFNIVGSNSSLVLLFKPTINVHKPFAPLSNQSKVGFALPSAFLERSFILGANENSKDFGFSQNFSPVPAPDLVPAPDPVLPDAVEPVHPPAVKPVPVPDVQQEPQTLAEGVSTEQPTVAGDQDKVVAGAVIKPQTVDPAVVDAIRKEFPVLGRFELHSSNVWDLLSLKNYFYVDAI